MPFFNEDELQSSFGQPRAVTQLPREPDSATTWQTIAAAFRQDNSVVSTGAFMSRGGFLGPVENFDFNALENVLGTEFEPYADRFFDADSDEDVEMVKNRIRAEASDRELLENGGLTAFGARLLAGTLDPVNFIPFAGWMARSVRGARAATGVGAAARSAAITGFSGALTGGFSTAASELALQKTQELRTVEESLMNVAGGVVLGGVVGAAIGGVSVVRQNRLISQLEKDLEINDTPVGNEGYNLAKALVTAEPEDMPEILSQFDLTTLSDQTLTGKPLFRKIAQALDGPGITSLLSTPAIRLIQSESLTARRMFQRIADNPFVTEANLVGIETPVSIETNVRMYKALSGSLSAEVSEGFKKYRNRIKNEIRAENDVALNSKNFKHQVALATMKNGTSDIPEVRELAALYRDKLLVPIGQEAERVGAISGLLRNQEDRSFYPNMWDRSKVINGRPRLKQIFMNWLSEDRRNTFARRRQVLSERRALRREIAGLTRAGSPQRFAQITTRLDEIADELKQLPTATRKNFTPEALSDAADDIISNILSQGDDQIFRDALPRGSRVGGSRVLDIDQLLIADFLDTDITSAMERYVSAYAPEIELRKVFGPDLDVGGTVDSINAEYNQIINRTTDPKRLRELNARRNSDIRDLRALVGRLRGTFGRPKDPDSLIERGAFMLRSWNAVTSLGGMVISSLPEMARMVQIDGFRSMFGSVIRPLTTAQGRQALKLARQDLRAAGAAWEVALNNSRVMTLADISDPRFAGRRLPATVSTLTNRFVKATLNTHYDEARMVAAGVLNQRFTMVNVGKWVDGTISTPERTQLARSGINKEAAERINTMWRQFGEIRDDVYIANTEKWTDTVARDIYNGSLNKQIAHFTTTPGIGDSPLWMSTSLGKTFAQFERFNFAATNSILLAGFQTRQAKDMAMLSTSFAIGMMTFAIKEQLAGRETPDDVRKWIAGGMDQSGVFGVLASVNDRINTITGRSIGTLLGLTEPRNVDTQRALGQFLGPSFGKTADVVRLFNTLQGGIAGNSPTAGDVRAIRRLVPFQNLFYFRQMFDKLEAGANHTFGNRPLGTR